MDKPKIKPINTNPKVLKRTVRTVKGLKKGVDKTAGAINKAKKAHNKLTVHMPCENNYHRPEEYMTGKITEKTSYSARKAGGKAVKEAKNLVEKRVKKTFDNRRLNQKFKFNEKYNADIKRETQNTIGKNIRHSTKGADSVTGNAIHAKKKAIVKTSKKTVKTVNRSLKTTNKGVKTAAKTTKKSAKAAKKAAMLAKRTALMTAKAIKYTVKTIIIAVKAAMAAIKGLIALIAAGGWIVIAIILIVAVILLIVSSPFGIFTNDTDGTTPTISDVVRETDGEYSSKINSMIVNADDVDEVVFEGESADAGYSATNWIDVLGVFTVKATLGDNPDEYMDVLIMDDEKVNELKKVFWDMNSITYEIQEETEQTPNSNVTTVQETSPNPGSTPEVMRILMITMEGKTYEQGAKIYKFTDEQNKVLEELMSPDYISMYMELCGMDTYNGLTPEQLAQLLNDLPSGKLGSVIVEYALSRLGDPYSQKKRGQGNYVDCSYFARWCYQQAGISSFTAGTAAEQARYCVDNALTIAKENLQVGDLIFWSFNTNGRFMDITHVGIYAGSGYVIDASGSRGMVVYRPIFGEGNIVVCGRPHVK